MQAGLDGCPCAHRERASLNRTVLWSVAHSDVVGGAGWMECAWFAESEEPDQSDALARQASYTYAAMQDLLRQVKKKLPPPLSPVGPRARCQGPDGSVCGVLCALRV